MPNYFKYGIDSIFWQRFRAARDLSIAGWGQENKSEEDFFFILFWGAKKKKNFFLPPFHSWPHILRERACPKEPKSEVLARSKQYYLGAFQFYEMEMHGWISLVWCAVVELYIVRFFCLIE